MSAERERTEKPVVSGCEKIRIGRVLSADLALLVATLFFTKMLLEFTTIECALSTIAFLVSAAFTHDGGDGVQIAAAPLAFCFHESTC